VLNCDVSLPRKDAGPSESTLRIYKDGKKIFSLSPYEAPISVFSSDELNSKLVTVWLSGNGSYLIKVFSFSEGKVKQVLDAVSGMMPEFAYGRTDLAEVHQRIIVSNMDWVKDSKSGESVKLPMSADIYEWDGSSYQAQKAVAWNDRFFQKR
jgi:hypothetical protein